jgi:membrane protease YdiL (CAAX protease family)
VNEEGQISEGVPEVETLSPPVVPPPLPGLATRTVVWNGIADSALAIFITFCVVLAGAILGFATVQIRSGGRSGASAGLIAFGAGVQEIAFASLAWRRIQKNREEGRAPLILGGPRLSAALLGVPCGTLVMILGGLIAKLMGATTPKGLADMLAGLRSHSWIAAVVFVLVAIVAPVCEEYFFRGAIFGVARANGNPWAGGIIASLLFATLHFNFRMFPYYLIFGAMNCWLMMKTKTLAAPIAAHITVNASACIAVLVAARMHP